MSKTIKAGFVASPTTKVKAQQELLTQRTMKRAATLGCDPRNSHDMAAAIVGRVMPRTKIVDGKRVWDLMPNDDTAQG